MRHHDNTALMRNLQCLTRCLKKISPPNGSL